MSATNSRQPRGLSLLARARVISMTLFTLFFFAAVFAGSIYASGTISGTVFRDFDANGSKGSTEPGLAGVTVNVYDSAGANRGSGTTNASGAYSISATGSGPYRVEFTLPAGLSSYQPSARSTDSVNGGTSSNSGSSVQFVPDGSTSNVNWAVNYPNDYCQNNPNLCATSYVNGSRTNGTVANGDVLFEWPYNNAGTTAPTVTANAPDIGSTWGLAYARSSTKLYIGAVVKRHVDIGPGDGQGSNPYGAIYVRDVSTGNAPVYFATIPNAGTVTRNTTCSPTLDVNALCGLSNPSHDGDAYAKVGKVGLGGVAISEDESTLYVVNLNDRKVYPVTIASATVGTGIAIPDPGCTNGTYRPWAAHFWHGLLYVGEVCDASSGAKTDLHGYVYTYNPGTATWNLTPVMSASLDMSATNGGNGKGEVVNCDNGSYDYGYYPWSDDGTANTLQTSANYDCRDSGAAGAPHIEIHPMPILSDIEFDRDSSMMIALTDRFGGMIGWRNYGPTLSDTQLYDVIVGGDILRACTSDNTTWTMESNGTCGGVTTSGANNHQGLGGGEWYFGEQTKADSSQKEQIEGGLAFVPNASTGGSGNSEVVATAQDPNQVTISQGVVKFFNTNTTSTKIGDNIYGPLSGSPNPAGYQLYVNGSADNITDGRFGKANGLGDLVALCDAAPIEIGNRIWNDANNNGIQDPGENPIAGVTVRLFRAGSPIGTAVTDTNGEYYFTSTPGSNDANTTDNIGQVNDGGKGIQIQTAYEIRVEPGQGNNSTVLAGLGLTTQNAPDLGAGDAGANADARDSDAAPASGNSVIPYTTGTAGTNNHTLDIGFTQARDYGDLPDTGAGTGAGNYQTLDSDGGAYHIISSGLNIGAADVVDPEGGTLQNAAATADDNSNTGFADDEDGVPTFPKFIPGQSATVNVIVNNPAGGIGSATLYGFIDWNGDGDFNDTGEAVSTAVPDGTVGTVGLMFTVPVGALSGSSVGARFRLTTDTLTLDNNGAIGSASDGEVEDYIVNIGAVGAIGNRVWVDEDSNGFQDKGEDGIPNVTVQLKNSAGAVIATRVTDSNGGYLFTNLPAGTYYVQVLGSTIPTGMTQTTLYPHGGADFYNQDQSQSFGYQIVLGTGETNLTADFGYNQNPTGDVNTGGPADTVAALGDRIWIDMNGNGAQDAGEIGVQGVEVTIYGSPGVDGIWGNGDDVPYTTGSYVSTRTTDANGYYMFDGLPPGQYSVRVTDSATASHNVLDTTQYTQTGDADHWGTTGTVNDNQTTIPVVLGPGDVFLNADFGYQPGGTSGVPALGSIGNYVWYDRDANGSGPDAGLGANEGNGTQNDSTEFGLGGVTVALIKDLNGNGVWDSGEPIIATTHTSDGTEDVDGDGKTDTVGFYRFLGLPIADGVGSDDYLVWVNDSHSVLAGLIATYDKDGSGPATGLAMGLGISAVSNLGTTGGSAYGTNDATDQDFGYTDQNVVASPTNPGVIGDRVWFDTSNDGVQDAGEAGIPGVIVNLFESDGTTLVATTTTGANGLYLFPNLNVDDGGGSHTYVVRVDESTLPGNMSQTFDADGVGTPGQSTTTLTPGAPIDLNQDFGYIGSGTTGTEKPGSIGNYVWNDVNANGTFDAGESGIGGVTLDLYYDQNGNGLIDSAGDVKIGTQTTDSNGAYLFQGLAWAVDTNPAHYVVVVTDTAGKLVGYWHSLAVSPNDPSDTSDDDSLDESNAISHNDPVAVTLTQTSANNRNADFGYYVVPGAVGNYVWLDVNKDGKQDGGEVGINDVIVTLTITYPNETVTVLTTKTGPEPGTGTAGYYTFGNLLQDEDYNGAGTYGGEPTFSIMMATPANYSNSPISAGGTTAFNDSDDWTGTSAQPLKGQTNTLFANNSATIASYDFGIFSATTAADVTNVKAKATSKGAVNLRWKSLTEANIAGFNVLRSASKKGKFVAVNDTLLAAKAPGTNGSNTYKYKDATVKPGKTYYYRIQVVRLDKSTAPTKSVKVKVPASTCSGTPNAPTLVSPADESKVGQAKLQFQWNAATCATAYTFELRKGSPDGAVVKTKTTTKSKFTFKKLEPGKTYVWRVATLTADGKAIPSSWWSFRIQK